VTSVEGGSLEVVRGNEAVFKPSADSFSLTVTGFDVRRDLVISALEV
jgi:hypothetical protein